MPDREKYRCFLEEVMTESSSERLIVVVSGANRQCGEAVSPEDWRRAVSV